ncbi:MAG: valine--tRNA ligase [Bacteroidales bacterium]|jgi:valyl-tRNA synthetase|nr:valine--tRNA ligase [Bacteroidales bacterium]MDI9575166.1 valine--tRNA ligase [Bacteroidota bacterium]MDY0400831.1 valine--tRNA ligase [Bacteroidales bacterium]HHW60084.1 valine--tRNA ligase [Bacteroidales bacterium]
MKLAQHYKADIVENKWYKIWLEKKYFHSEPNEKEPYTIVIPPPNITGILHMGHVLNNTLQDILIRRARMLGYNACWVPGTDHASIATEARIVANLKSKGIDKHSLTRDEFMKYAWEWKEKHGGIILEQLKKLGASCDWDRTTFTMDDHYYKSVIHVFVDLYNKGLIYRSHRMVNWDPLALTALSDEEVIYKKTNSKLYYVKYFLTDDSGYLTIATTRPETILADTAVAVNPNDDRYKHLIGKYVYVPLVKREIPIIADQYVDPEFGTGCLKVTPAHDLNDYEIGKKHNLEIIDIFTPDARLNENAKFLIGQDRFEARENIIPLLEKEGNLTKIEDYENNVAYSERTDVPIEPRLSLQWFLKVEELSKPAMQVVLDGTIKFYPDKFINTYRHWMKNIKDWCISRQLWWGHRIPVWYLPNGEFVVAHNEEEAYTLALKKNPNLKKIELHQDDDVLDTWFSSWIWPIAVFNGILQPNNEDINYYYPTNDLVTAPEILFFWVARMIMAGLEYRKQVPFYNVYFTGIVRDKLGRKMSKSLGNSPDPLDLIDKYGADGVRMGMLFSSPLGNDLLFDEALCEQGRNFANKIWNALRLVKMWKIDPVKPTDTINVKSISWFNEQLKASIIEINHYFDEYRISDALKSVYKTIWDYFCSWYLELIKPNYGEPVDANTYNSTINFFKTLMQLLHPFMPFITEEIWHLLQDNYNIDDTIMLTPWPTADSYDENIINDINFIFEFISTVRSLKAQYNITKEDIEVYYNDTEYDKVIKDYEELILKMAQVKSINKNKQLKNTAEALVRTITISIPITETNIEEEKEKILKELDYYKGFLANVNKKLKNENFLKKAPDKVIENEKKKQQDTIKKIESLKKLLKKYEN